MRKHLRICSNLVETRNRAECNQPRMRRGGIRAFLCMHGNRRFNCINALSG